MKKIALAWLLAVAVFVPAKAEEKDLTPAVMAEVAMAEELVAMGMARKEPLMILAAIRMRATLGADTGATGDGFTSLDDAIAAAKEMATGDDAMMGLIEDVAAESSRRMCIYARNGVCY
ncbi:MAG: hypothetical protein AAGJ28_14630 [Pseudomonadota bacterium]